MPAYMKRIYIIAVAALLVSSCHYLDVVPTSKATEEDIFKTSAQAKNFRFNMMTFMPNIICYKWSPDNLAGDDFTTGPRSTAYWFPGKSLLYNMDNPSQTYFGYWAPCARENGTNYDMFRGIRYAYYFKDNISRIPDITPENAKRYEGDSWFVIGYYHETLLEYYGPTVLVKRFIPFDSEEESEIAPSRSSYDECVDFICSCYDKAIELLPATIPEAEWGLPTSVAAAAYKARVLMWAASALVNGNTDYADFKNKDGKQLINQTYDKEKWKRAMDASAFAIQLAEGAGYKLYTTKADPSLTPFQQASEDYRCTFTEKDWNGEEFLFAKGDGSGMWNLNNLSHPRAVLGDQSSWKGTMVPTLESVLMYYTKNGLPIDVDPLTKDLDWYSVAPGDSTALLHRNREPRFYATIGYDRGDYHTESKVITLYCRAKELHGYISATTEYQTCTGYFCQKWGRSSDYYDYETRTAESILCAYPYLRLSELYLNYAEADFEYDGTLSAQGLEYLNKVRKRAGLPNFEDSWAIVGGIPTGDKLRSVLHQERSIEFLFEGRRFHDLRRWKESEKAFSTQMMGWNITGKTQEDFYKIVPVEVEAERCFAKKNYFMAIPQQEIDKNPNLVQNPGY